MDRSDLQPPGAGLPNLERRVLNQALRTSSALLSRRTVSRLFSREGQTILRLVRAQPDAVNQTRVLIKRVRGMEDSSRNWSNFMVLEHLMIVNRIIGSLIRQLCSGSAPHDKVRIEDVKPDADVGSAIVEEFSASVNTYVEQTGQLETLPRFPRHVHPWFGSLSARQWHSLAAVHMRIHRRQIQRIIARVTSG